jgi:DNA-binding NarL/FixJ family response regulator
MIRMTKRIALVGHCGADATYLRIAVTRTVKDVVFVRADDHSELNKAIAEGLDLVLLNRRLDWGFETDEGVELIRQLRAEHPNLRLMLVSNYPDAQEAALQAGALPGFGKDDLRGRAADEKLRAALSLDDVPRA